MFTERDGEVQMLGPKTDARFRGCSSALGRCNSHDDVDLIKAFRRPPSPGHHRGSESVRFNARFHTHQRKRLANRRLTSAPQSVCPVLL